MPDERLLYCVQPFERLMSERPLLCFPTQPEISSEAEPSECHTRINRRDVVGTAALAASTALLNVPLISKADECKLETASNGLQYCDLVAGTGPPPEEGALIRYCTLNKYEPIKL